MAIEPTPPPPPPPPSGGSPGDRSYTIGGKDLSLGTLVSLIGAALLLISVFLNWYTGKVSINAGVFKGSQSASISGWDATDAAKLVFLLALIAGGALVVAAFVPTVNLPWPAWMVSGPCAALALLLILYRIISKPGAGHAGSFNIGNGAGVNVSISASYGIFVALLAAIAILVGAYFMMNEPAQNG